MSLMLLLTAASVRGQTTMAGQAPSPDRPIRQWLVLGTFPADTGADRVTRPYVPDEARLAPSEGDSVAGHVWHVARADSLGRLDFNEVFTQGPHDRAVAYAVAYLLSPEDRTIRLAIETDDDGRLWANGQLVYSREIARSVTQTDTVTLRLGRGWNRLLYKVINRSGGFGMGGRLLASSPDDISQLTTSAARPAQLTAGPAPFLTLGAAVVAGPPALDAAAGDLDVSLRVPAVRWGGLRGPVSLRLAGTESPVPEAGAGPPPDVALNVSWIALGRALARGEGIVRARSGRATLAGRETGLDAGGLLELLSRPIVVRGWLRRDSADVRSAAGAAAAGWSPLPPHDSTAPGDTAAGAIGVVAKVPPALDGLTLELDAAEYGPGARLLVNGVAHQRDTMGRITLCTPCRVGARLDIVVQPGDSLWWDPPRIIVRDAGWWAVAQGTRWARVFTGDSSFAPLALTAADSVLKAALVRGRRRYHALIAAHLARLAPAERAIAGDTLWAVGNSHIDAAWLWRWPETVKVVEATWGSAVKLMRKYPEMEFAGSAARYYTWLEERDPDLLARIQALAKAGRWHPVGGWWVEADANMPGGEALVRQALYGQRAFKRLFGEISHVAWIPDTFGYTWQLPQIFHLSGMDFFVTQKLRWNDTDKWTADRNVFWWQGRDGTRVLTYIPYGYDHDLDGRRLARQWLATKDSSAAPVLYTLYGVGDHGGGPTAAMLDRRRALNRIPTFPPVVDRSPDSTLALMRSEMPDSAPVIDDELYLEYHRGVLTTQSETKRWNRRMQNLLTSAEVAATAAAGPTVSAGFGRPGGPAGYPYAALHEAWTLTLFNQFHDILPGSGIGPVYKDAAVMYRHADSLATSVLQGAAIALAAHMNTEPPAPDARPFLVLNPNARPRGGVVRLVLHDSTAQALDDHGRRLPSALVGDTLLVRVPPVPATGTSLIFVREGEKASTPAAVREPFAWLRRLLGHESKTTVLENRYLRVEIDPATGEIARMLDKRDGREVLADSAHGNVLMTMPDNPKQWDAWNIDQVTGPWTPMRDSVRVGIAMRDGLAEWVDVVRVDTAVNARVTQRYVLPDEAARLDIVTTVDWHASHRLLKAAFPLAVHPDSVWAEIPYGAIGRPTVPETRKDSARYETSMQRWIDASQDGFGVALVNDGKYGYDVQGDTVRLTLLRAPKYPDPDADMGTHTFTYSVVPHAGDWRAPAVLDAAEALNQPLRAVPVSPHPGEGRGAPFLRIEGGSAVLGALKRSEDDDALVVRLVEREGRASLTRIVLPWPFTATEADLLERPTGERRQAANDTLEVHLRPWQIETLLIRRQ
ncbi:MAG: glycoside hydrolase family 38 C-terminal domain-containing protein [Gemmatimonadota bacterium]